MRNDHWRWTHGMLANHIWSYADWGDTDVSATFSLNGRPTQAKYLMRPGAQKGTPS
jgi:hypothetical protein